MATDKHERSAYFPKIEAKYGQPMKYWFGIMKAIHDRKYPEQIAFLREEHGFSKAHANALVMYSRGSASSKRFQTFSDFLSQQDEVKRKTIRKIFKVIQAEFPKLELVMAWNQPILKSQQGYVFGLSVSKNHLLIAPFNSKVLQTMSKQLEGYKVNKKTVQVPINWIVDEKILYKMVSLTIKELKSK